MRILKISTQLGQSQPQPQAQPGTPQTGRVAEVSEKLRETTMIGALVHGNLIEMWANPMTHEVLFAFTTNGFLCKCCPQLQSRLEDC